MIQAAAPRSVDFLLSGGVGSRLWPLTNEFALALGDGSKWTEPGRHFEWCELTIDGAEWSGRPGSHDHAPKLCVAVIANGLNRSTGLAYGTVSRHGIPHDQVSRSGPPCEAKKAAIAHGPDIEKPETRLFRRHLDSAREGSWIDRVDEQRSSRATDVLAAFSTV